MNYKNLEDCIKQSILLENALAECEGTLLSTSAEKNIGFWTPPVDWPQKKDGYFELLVFESPAAKLRLVESIKTELAYLDVKIKELAKEESFYKGFYKEPNDLEQPKKESKLPDEANANF